MDLFHAITQGIDSVLTCDWYDSFKGVSSSNSSSTSRNNSRRGSLSGSVSSSDNRRESDTRTTSSMASGTDQKTMDTAPGGESTQYESIKTVTNPTERDRGQLGTGPNTSETPSQSEERGQKTTENIRYGQNISESGVGGKTSSSIGSAHQAGGHGGKSDDSEPPKDTRPEQGYGPGSNVNA